MAPWWYCHTKGDIASGAGMLVSLTVLMEMLDEQIPTAHYNVPILGILNHLMYYV